MSVARPSSKELNRLALLLLVALALRAIVLVLYSEFEPIGDQLAYIHGAREIQSGEIYSGTRGPAYSAWIAFSWWIAGSDGTSLLAPRIANLLLSLLFIVAVWATGRQLCGPKVGLIAAAVLAVHPNYVSFPLYLLSENLYNLCVVAGVYAAIRSLDARWPLAVAAGIVLGLGTLTREMMAWFIPAAAFAIAFLLRANRTTALLQSGALLLGAVLVVAPWTARNFGVHDEFVLVGYADGIPLFEGNYTPPVKLRQVLAKWEGRPIKQSRWRLFREWNRSGVTSRLEHNKRYRKEAWKSIDARQPTWIFEKLASNGPSTVQPVLHPPFLWSATAQSESSDFVRFTMLGSYLAIHLLAFLLLPFGLARWKLFGPALLPLGYLVFSILVHVVANAGPMRFQMPYEWVLLLGSASAIGSTAPIKKWVAAALCALALAAQLGAHHQWSVLAGVLFRGDQTANEIWQEDTELLGY